MIDIILKIITWTGGVLISIWIIKLLREINSKQKEHILLIEKAFKEREKTRDQKIEFLDQAQKKQIELIEKEKSIIVKTIESEKKNLELQLSNKPDEDSNISDTILELKTELLQAISKINSINIEPKDLQPIKEFIAVTNNINRKTNYISYRDSYNKGIEKINIWDFITNSFLETTEYKPQNLNIDGSITELKPILFDKKGFYVIITEIINNTRHHSNPNDLKIYGFEDEASTTLIFENPTTLDYNPKLGRGGGLGYIQQVMEQNNGRMKFTIKNGFFQLMLNFKKY